MNIADRVQNLRKSKGISQEELADKIGVSRQAVSKWESEQSVPDIDKIIIMSDFFDVTTDYILKGIESEKPTSKVTVDARVFVTVATALNFIGLIVACAIWYEEQVAIALAIGLIFMTVGCMVFSIGLTHSTIHKEKAWRLFWVINTWFLVFIPLSVIYNALFTGYRAPYPLLGSYSLVAFPVFWLVYLASCLGVIFVQAKMNRNN